MYDTLYQIGDMTQTRGGDLVFIEKRAQRAGIFTQDAQLKTNINIPGARSLRGVDRHANLLFITDQSTDAFGVIHVLWESGSYIRAINSTLPRVYGIAATNNHNLWVTTFADDAQVAKLTTDTSYTIITKTEVFTSAPATSSVHYWPSGIALYNDHVCFVCMGSSQVHIVDISGKLVVPPVGGLGQGDGQLFDPSDLTIDGGGRILVADVVNARIVMYSQEGKFLRNLVTQDDGLVGPPLTLYLNANVLYVAGYKFFVIQLE